VPGVYESVEGEIWIVLDPRIGRKLAGVKPVMESLEDARADVLKIDASCPGFFKTPFQSCFEERRVIAEQFFMKCELLRVIIFLSYDGDESVLVAFAEGPSAY